MPYSCTMSLQAAFILVSCVTLVNGMTFPGSGGNAPAVTIMTFVPHATLPESTIWTTHSGGWTKDRPTKGTGSMIMLWMHVRIYM